MQIRFQVFVEEQGVSLEEEVDAFEDQSQHWLVRNGFGQAIATMRFREKTDVPGSYGIKGRVGKMERVAVLPDYRGAGIGRQLMIHVADAAKKQGFDYVYLHGQVQSQGFYEKLGYVVIDKEPFDEAGILHVKMMKML
jgi:predicted GNAT family N-acyltransferase